MRATYPMPFVRKCKQFGRQTFEPCCLKCLQTLTERHTVVALAMNDQNRSVPVGDKIVGRKFGVTVGFRFVPVGTADVVVGNSQRFGVPIGGGSMRGGRSES